tara:strand:- start:139 stop:552 length:414 start_codon:yes stop_codon:yes gene_type:complete
MEPTDIKDVVVKYSSYTDAQRKATQKYRCNNREKVNEQRKKYYKVRKDADPSFLEYKRTKAREYYQRKKAVRDSQSKSNNKIDFIDEVKPCDPEEHKPLELIVEEVKPVVEVECKPDVKPEVEEPKPKKSKKSKKSQ